MGSRSLVVLGGAVCAVAFVAFLVLAVERESGPRTDVIAGSVLGAAALLIVSVVVRSTTIRAGLLAVAAGILCAWAIIGSLSVGVLLLPAAVLAYGGLRRETRRTPWRRQARSPHRSCV